jgi:acyl-CoA thioester hydrolase
VSQPFAPHFVHGLRVRYHECDMQGIVFNSHYYTWIDDAHTEWIRSLLGPIEVLHGFGVDVMVAESSCRYFASARYDQELEIEVRLESLSTTAMTTAYTFRHDDHLLAEGRIRHVCVDREAWAKTPWPDDVRAAFTPALDA